MSNSDETITWRVRPSKTQKLYVLEFLEKHPQLVSRRRDWDQYSNCQIRKDLWDELTETLNNMGHACKRVDTWQKYWRDQRAFVRERHAAYMKSCKGNVRNLRNRVKPLNDYEKRVLALVMPHTNEQSTDSDSKDQLNSKIKVEVEDDQSQLGNLYESSLSSFNQLSPPQPPPTPPSSSPPLTSSSPPPPSSSPPPPPTPLISPPPPPQSPYSDIKIKSIRSLLIEEQQDHCHRGSGKRIKIDRELERKTIALLERNEEFNREMEIKKLEVEKEKVAALKELIDVVRLGFACIAGQQLK